MNATKLKVVDARDIALPEETMAQAINRITRSHRGDTYQNGVRPGQAKLAQFREAFAFRGIPKLYEQEGKGDDTMAWIKLFDPCGSWSWFLTEFSLVAPDGVPDLAFALVDGHEEEQGYVSIGGEDGLAFQRGRLGIGIEIDMHWAPRPLVECYKHHEEYAR